MHFALLLFFIVIAPVISGCFGAVYDMIVYTLSPEFFTEYRFPQFDISQKMRPIVGAAIIGFSNSWAIGIPIGIILATMSYMHRSIHKTFKYMIISYVIAIVTSIVFTSIGLMLMKDQLSHNMYIGTDKALQRTVEIIVDMNNFTQAGALIGTALACAWQLYMILKKKERAEEF
ncbi:MAG: hypothetical protein JWO58_1260 [Chitinophagaceae bacterium]|nr:hypothetical protein [Chitinophagaceae bacterium]